MARSLRQEQSRFTIMVRDLITFAHDHGYTLTFGDAYRDPRVPYGHPESLHKMRLAIDLNLFKNGVYLAQTEDHQLLGEYWRSLGGTWGGEWGDGNHYSLEWEGRK